MNAELEKLVDLQQLDNEIRKLEKQCQDKEKEIVALQVKVAAAQSEQETAQQALEEQQKEHRSQERDLDAKDSAVKKHKTQLMSVKTNREYQALQSEIDEEEKQKDAIEEKILELLESIDGFQSKLKEAKQDVKDIEEAVAQEKAQKKQQLNEIQTKLQNTKKERDKLSKDIPDSLLKEYNKLVKSKNGVAIALADNCTCQGCFINIPPQDYEELKKGGKIYYCSSCSRILYWRRMEAVV